jgi:hypothetical protein
LTPQDGALNKSYEWKQIDATVDLCAFHGYEPSYTVKYFYNDNTYTNRPQIYNSKIYVFIPGTCPPDVKWDDLDIMNRNPTPDDRALMSNFTRVFKQICRVPGSRSSCPLPRRGCHANPFGNRVSGFPTLRMTAVYRTA